MMYNMDFLIAGLVFLVLILYHFMSRDRIENMNSREFQIFIVVGILDIVLDIVSSMMIARPQHCYAKLLMVVLTLFYLMQVMVPYALFCYTKSLCPTMMQMGKKMQLFPFRL